MVLKRVRSRPTWDLGMAGRRAKPMNLFTSSYVEAASTLAVIASSNEPLLFLAGDLNARGKIIVDYRSNGLDWSLSVRDDGIGMPKTPQAEAGLGTGIVEALAKHLGAIVQVIDFRPGRRDHGPLR